MEQVAGWILFFNYFPEEEDCTACLSIKDKNSIFINLLSYVGVHILMVTQDINLTV